MSHSLPLRADDDSQSLHLELGSPSLASASDNAPDDDDNNNNHNSSLRSGSANTRANQSHNAEENTNLTDQSYFSRSRFLGGYFIKDENYIYRLYVFYTFVLVLFALILSLIAHPHSAHPTPPVPSLSSFVTKERLITHLTQLAYFASLANNTRNIGTAGFARTVQYIEHIALNSTENNNNNNNNYTIIPKSHSISVTQQDFPLALCVTSGTPAFNISLPTSSISYVYPNDYTLLYCTGTGNVANGIFYVINNRGCVADDYKSLNVNANIPAIFIIRRGNCTFQEKIDQAHAYKASAVIIYNKGDNPASSGDMDVFSGTAETFAPFPVVTTSYKLGVKLIEYVNNYNTNNLFGFVSVDAAIQNISVSNVLSVIPANQATSSGKFPASGSSIVVGAHTDSVGKGPGINDNGSGSMCILTILEAVQKRRAQLGYSPEKNDVVFGFFGAEEEGLKGSEWFVKHANNDTTDPLSLPNLALNLNYDMLGSVNFERLIYKAEGVNASAGSVTIQKLYETLFLQRNISYNYTEFNGRSDYGPFLAEHIAAGGLFSGAEEIKDFDGRKQFGGINNVQLDPCYHQACDTLQNIDFDNLLLMCQVAADAVDVLSSRDDLRKWLIEEEKKYLKSASAAVHPAHVKPAAHGYRRQTL